MSATPHEPIRQPTARREDPLADLVPRVTMGDAVAANTLIRALAPSMLRAIRMLLGPRNPDAEDVLQDGLMRLLRAIPEFRYESTLRHFAVRIAMHASADAARRYARIQRLKEEAAAPELVGQNADVEVDMARRQQIAIMLEQSLSPVQRETLILQAALGYELSEISTMMGVPVNTVRGRLQTAKSTLREVFGTEEGNHEQA